MVSFRYPGHICQIMDWYEHDDGVRTGQTRSQTSVRGVLTDDIDTAEERLSLARSRVVAASSGPCAFVNPVARGIVRAPPAAFDRLRGNSGTATISPQQARAPEKCGALGPVFPGVEQQVQIDSQRFRVIRPTDAVGAGKNLATTVQIAESLRAVPAFQRAATDEIFVSPIPHPSSTATHTTAGEGGSGEIILYPMSSVQTQNDFDNRITHESGHNFQKKFWSGSQAVAQWQVQANLDRRRPSPYCVKGAGEDFSEFNVLFNTTRGTRCEVTCRQIYPHRWAKMIEYLLR
jgi:hypothetical protein